MGLSRNKQLTHSLQCDELINQFKYELFPLPLVAILWPPAPSPQTLDMDNFGSLPANGLAESLSKLMMILLSATTGRIRYGQWSASLLVLTVEGFCLYGKST
jgi:hypothetical protein